MKKLVAILLTLTLILSMCVVSALAVTYDKEVWTQDFEKGNTDDTKANWNGTGTNNSYTNGGRFYGAGGSGNPSWNDGYIHTVGTQSGSGKLAGTKIMLDQSRYELGKNYKLTAEIEFIAANEDGTGTIVAYVLKGTGYNTSSNGTYSFKNGDKRIVSTGTFTYNETMKAVEGGINFRVDISAPSVSTTDATVYDAIKIDNVKIVEVITETDVLPTSENSVFASYKLGDTMDFENAGYNRFRAYTSADPTAVYDVDHNGYKYIVGDPTGADNKVFRTPKFNHDGTTNYIRTDMVDVLAGNNAKGDKTYKVSFKFYPQGFTNRPVYFAIKADATQTRYDGLKYKELTDLVPNQWNDVSFTYKIDQDAAVNIAITQRGTDGTGMDPTKYYYYDCMYLDDIVIEESYEDNADFIFGDTTPDAGYYAETKDAETKDEGVIAFTSQIIENYLDIIDSFGMYFYRTDKTEDEKNADLPSDDVASLIENDGVFSATVEKIAQGYFTTRAVAKPYVVIDGKTIFGDAAYYCVDDGNKWLGPKDE